MYSYRVCHEINGGVHDFHRSYDPFAIDARSRGRHRRLWGGETSGLTNGNGNGNGTNPLAANSVNVGDNFFNPESVTVSTGTTVTWTWIGATDPYTGVGPNTHTVTFNDGVGSSGAKSSGTQTRQFNETGTFGYFCIIHGPAVMSGTIVVQ